MLERKERKGRRNNSMKIAERKRNVKSRFGMEEM